MSHPIPGHDYGEKSYESHSPHKDIQGEPREKKHPFDRGSAKSLPHLMKHTKKLLNEAGKKISHKARTGALKKSMVSKPTGPKNFHKRFSEPKGHSDMSGTSGTER